MFDRLLDANLHFASSFSLADLTNRSRENLAVVTCMDVRIEPLTLFEMKIGDANVIRNAGGRVTADVIRSLVLATTLLGVSKIIVLHHDECALSETTDVALRTQMTNQKYKVDPTIEFLSMSDPARALAEDVIEITNSSALRGGLTVVGWNYVPSTGLVFEVVPPILKSE